MDHIKSITTEFHYASIYDDVKTLTTGTSQDVYSKRVQQVPHLFDIANGSTFPLVQQFGPSRPTELHHPQPRHRFQSSLQDIFDTSQNDGFKALEPYHILPPPPPPPPPPSPTCRDLPQADERDPTSEKIQYALDSPFDVTGSKYLAKYQHETPTYTLAQIEHGSSTSPKAVSLDECDFRPDSPWSADSGIEISPPRPVKPRDTQIRCNNDRAESGKRESGPGLGLSLGLEVEVETEIEMNKGVGWVEEDEKTWKSTFGSPTRSGPVANGYRSQGKPSGNSSTEEIYIEVEEWCPGGAGCRHYDQPQLVQQVGYGWMPMTPPQELGGMARDYEQYETGFRMGVAFPDDIIEPGTPPMMGAIYGSSLPRSSFGPFEYFPPPAYQHGQLEFERYPVEPLFHPGFNPGPQPAHSPVISFPLHIGAPMLLHSPGIPPRPLNVGQYLYLKDHYSYSDPMLGRKGAWKCSLYDCGSREPPNFVRSGPWENPIEISELGAPENRIMLSRLGFEVDLKKKERLAEKRYVKAQRGRVRSSEKRLNPNYIKLGPKRTTPKGDVRAVAAKKIDEESSVPCGTIDVNWFGKGKHHTRRQSCQGDIKRRIACYLEADGGEDDDSESRSVT